MTEAGNQLKAAMETLSAPGALYEMQQCEVDGVPMRTFVHAPNSLRDVYEFSCGHGDADFLVYQDERYSFTESFQQAARIGNALVNRYGVAKGDRVAIASRNYPEWVFAFMAITSVGGIAVPLNAWGLADELEYVLKDSGAKVLFADAQRLARLAPRLRDLDVATVAIRMGEEDPGPDVARWEALSADFAAEMPPVELTPDDSAHILYTSGTTGSPKGALSTHRAAVHAILSFEIIGQVRALPSAAAEPPAEQAPSYQLSILLTVPLFHVTGSHAILLTSFRAGRKIVMMYKWDAEDALKLVEAERITTFTGVPTMSWEMMRSPNFDKYDLSSLDTVGGGGAPMPPEQVREMEQRFSHGRPGVGYGLTETNAVGAVNGADTYQDKPRSCGLAASVCDLKVVDKEGVTLGADQRGEICIRGPVVIRGYWHKPEASAEAIRDGWLHTGDIGRLDEEGFVYIEDRAKDMIIRGGENIYCAEVEAAIYEHPAVFEATVFGLPDERLGEELAVAVMVRPDCELGDQELRDHVGQRLAKFKVPRYVFLQEEQLTRGATGKILKRAIRDATMQQLGLS